MPIQRLRRSRLVRALHPYADPRVVVGLLLFAALLLGMAAADDPTAITVAHAAPASSMMALPVSSAHSRHVHKDHDSDSDSDHDTSGKKPPTPTPTPTPPTPTPTAIPPTPTPSPSPISASGFVTTDGVQFLDGSGHPLALAGYTIYPATAGGTAAWRSNAIRPFIDSELALGLSAGQNLVRPTDFWDKTNTSQVYNDPTVWSNMDYLVSQAQARHVYVLMDLSAYKWLLVSQGKDPYNAANWTTYLQFVGARYRNNTDIVAYSIVGEPPAPTSQAQADALVAFYAQVTDTLAAADPHHLISAGGFNHMEDGAAYQWWQRIYALPHNDVCGFKTYSQRDLGYMATIAADTAALHKPSLDEEFGAPQSLGDATWSGAVWNGFSGSRAQFYTDVYRETGQYHVAADIFWNLATLAGAARYDVSPLTPAVWAVIQAHSVH